MKIYMTLLEANYYKLPSGTFHISARYVISICQIGTASVNSVNYTGNPCPYNSMKCEGTTIHT